MRAASFGWLGASLSAGYRPAPVSGYHAPPACNRNPSSSSHLTAPSVGGEL